MKQQLRSVTPSVIIVPIILAIGGAITFAIFAKDIDILKMVKSAFYYLFQGEGVEYRIAMSALLIGVGNGLFIPMNALLLAVVFFLPGWSGFIACMLGALLAAVIGYAYGYWLDLSVVKKRFGQKYDLLVQEVCKDGLKSVIALCFAPVAPNTVTNIFAGVCKIPLWKLLLGTVIGFLPGVSLLTLLGREIRQMFEEPGAQTAIAIGGVVLLIVVSMKIGKRITKKLEAQDGE